MTATLLAVPSTRDRVRARSAQVVRDIFAEHFPGPVSVLDVTYGPGGCWSWPYQAAGITLTASDLNPAVKADHHWDFRNLSAVGRAFDVVCFDPPFTAAGCSDWAHTYGICRKHGGPRNTHETGQWLIEGTRECCQVARKGVVVKFKACVESGRLTDHWPAATASARATGWQLVDEWRTFGERPQPKGRTYTTKVEPTRYCVFKPHAAAPLEVAR